jgi:AraC family transcriptional regulator
MGPDWYESDILDLPITRKPTLVGTYGGIAPSAFPERYSGVHCNPFWVVNLLEAPGELRIAGQSVSYRPGWAIATPPGIPHRWSNHGRVPIVYAHFVAGGEPAGIPIAQDLGPRWPALHALLLDASRRVLVEPDRAVVALWHLLWELSARPPGAKLVAEHPAVRAVLAAAADPTDTAVHPHALAQLAGVTPRHLNRLWTSAFGMPLAVWLRRRRLDQARQLLTGTNLPVRRVAEMTGFPDIQHFNKAIRRQFGASPRSVRQSTGPSSEKDPSTPDPLVGR